MSLSRRKTCDICESERVRFTALGGSSVDLEACGVPQCKHCMASWILAGATQHDIVATIARPIAPPLQVAPCMLVLLRQWMLMLNAVVLMLMLLTATMRLALKQEHEQARELPRLPEYLTRECGMRRSSSHVA